MTAILVDAHIVSAVAITSYKEKAEAAIVKNFGVVVNMPEHSTHIVQALISTSEPLIKRIQELPPPYLLSRPKILLEFPPTAKFPPAFRRNQPTRPNLLSYIQVPLEIIFRISTSQRPVLRGFNL